METLNHNELIIPEREIITTNKKPFIEANTKDVGLSHLENDCVIPVFSKDNETTISHQEFIHKTLSVSEEIFGNQGALIPEIRTSHVVKGRIPSAIGKPVKDLLDNEKTVYYERMMFAIEIPDITATINGNLLNLTLGGIRAYNHENLYNKKTFERFKFFIGFKNMVCCNMCVSSDGYVGDIRVASTQELESKIFEIINSYNQQSHIATLQKFPEYELSESQFAQLIGRCRLYNYLPKEEKLSLAPLLMNDGQIATVAKQYYEDENFKRNGNGSINLWNFYNLFTEANKSSYIDTFTERSLNAYELTQAVQNSLENKTSNWFLN
ncbi:MAG TPA: DUF3871 family protein [Aequorivita sp.]|nr:DUF3871 family protein [Aequorivita sp.]